MKNNAKINYFFMILAIGIVSTTLSSSTWAQTEGNSQNQTSSPGQQGAGTIEELQSLTTNGSATPKTTNDTTPISEELGKETSTDQGLTGNNEQQGGQQEDNQSAGTMAGTTEVQEDNQSAGTMAGTTEVQEDNQSAGTIGGQQEENKSGNPLSEVGKAIGELFK
jgi:hypothetical protein